jgi:hypothetical protein
VDRYNETRRALLAAPQQEEAWLRLSAACQEADRLMDAYRKKPDASREELSFGRESALCRQFAAAAHWPQLQAVFAP